MDLPLTPAPYTVARTMCGGGGCVAFEPTKLTEAWHVPNCFRHRGPVDFKTKFFSPSIRTENSLLVEGKLIVVNGPCSSCAFRSLAPSVTISITTHPTF